MKITLSSYSKQISGQIHLSSSKSESNRALIINALSGNKLTLHNLSDARDTQTMQKLLFTTEKVWDVLDAGTTMRFCTAFLAIRGEQHIITGTDRMKNRPIGLLVNALKKIGADISYLEKEGYPPLKISKILEQKADEIEIPGNISSQYISALLMIGPVLPNGLKIHLTGEIFSRPYIEMTLELMRKFGIESAWQKNTIELFHQNYQEGEYTIESDWSGASYWYSLVSMSEKAEITLSGLRKNSLQGDHSISDIMNELGVTTDYTEEGVVLTKKDINSDLLKLDFKKCPDLAQTVMVSAAANGVQLEMTGLESLKIKETDRITAMQNELRKIGAELKEEGQTWRLIPGSIPEEIPEIETYEDHRMAMAFAPACLLRKVIIKDPDVVKKSYPGFWEDLKSIGVLINQVFLF